MPYHRRSPMSPLQSHFGQIDIYLFDQLLRGRIVPGMRIFDAGCGSGRNLVYLLREGYEVFGADPDPRAIAATRALSASLAPRYRLATSTWKPSKTCLLPMHS